MTILARMRLVRYVVSRLSVLKGGYRRELESAFAPGPVPVYFATRRAEARLLGYVMGLEAWHHVLFGEVRGQPDGRWLASSVAAAYDDAVDLEGFREWSAVECLLADEGRTRAEFGPGPAAAALGPSLRQLRLHAGTAWDLFRQCLHAINEATRESFEAATRPSPDPGALRRAAREKGGRSFQMLAAVAGERLSEKVLEVAYEFGAACQLADDIYDVEEDVRIGQHTLASTRLIDMEDRHLIEGAVGRLPPLGTGVSPLLVAAWRTHLTGALRAYDADSRRSPWRHDVGQAAFRLGVGLIPGRA